jgi:hypothetical protein
MIFECMRCQKCFDNKTHYNNHLTRKIPCKEVINKKIDEDVKNKLEIPNTTLDTLNVVSNTTSSSQNLDIILIQNNIFINSKENGFKCLICNIIYKHSQTLSNHKKSKHPNYEIDIQNINKENKKSEIDQFKDLVMTQIENLNEKNKQLEEKNKQLELLVKTSKTNTKKIINNTNNTNNSSINNGSINNGSINNGSINNGQIINNNFNIVSLGDEDIKKLTQEEKLTILKSRNSAFINLVKMIHLNERLPEFHNVLINNIKSNYGSIVDDNKIILRKKDKIIADVISNRLTDLKDLVDEYKETKHLSRREKDILDEMIIFAEHYQLDDEDIDGNIIKPDKDTLKKNKEIFDDLIYAFYNNRLLIDRTLKKLTENNQIDMLLDV